MELMTKEKKGFKRTDFGLIPEDWTHSSIGNVAEVKIGRDLKEASYSKTPTEKYKYPVFSNTVDSFGLYGFYDFKEYQGKSVTVIGRGVGLGTAFIRDSAFGAIGRLLVIEPNQKVDYKYLGYYLNGKLKLFKESGGIPQLTGVQIKKYNIAFPPTLEEQQAIASALSDVDELIRSLNGLIQKKESIKKGAMQKLLTGKVRLAGFDEDWELKTLGDHLKFQTGNPFSSKFFNKDGNGLRLIKNRDLKTDDQVIYYTGNYSELDIVNNGDLLIGMDGDFIPVIWRKGKALLNQRVGRVNPVEGISISFLSYYLRKPLEEIQNSTSATTVKHLSHKDVEKIQVKLPCIPEQKAIAQILSDMDRELQTLRQKREKYKQIKQGMMQELLTGKTRLVEEKRSKREIQSKPRHNWEFDEAVLISVLADRFGNKEFPLGRFRRTKYSYLVRRYLDNNVDHFLKKAAGPYNPKTRYSGPEKIALNNGYVSEWKNGNRIGLVSDENIEQALSYFEDWYGQQAIDWLDEWFRYAKNNELELLTTVDKARIELEEKSGEVRLSAVKEVIASHPEWQPKLERELFSDEKIEEAIHESVELFG